MSKKVNKDNYKGKEVKVFYEVDSYFLYDLDEWDMKKTYEELTFKKKDGSCETVFFVDWIFSIVISDKDKKEEKKSESVVKLTPIDKSAA